MRQTIDALVANEGASKSNLFIFSDAPANIEAKAGVLQVRQFLSTLKAGFASITIIEHTYNLGLANSIIHGVSMLCEHYGRVIVLEDDLLTSPFFLRYMNQGLMLWERELRVQSICGYMFPVQLVEGASTFFLNAPHSWGWATWQDRWSMFNADGRALLQEIKDKGLQKAFNMSGPHSYVKMLRDQIAGRNHSWFIRWYATGFLRQQLSLYPAQSLVRNIGIDGSGVHCAKWKINPYVVNLYFEPITMLPQSLNVNLDNFTLLRKYFFKIKLLRYVNFFYRNIILFWGKLPIKL
jgi:hypothetical protein